MGLIWPGFLYLLGIIPIVIGIYIWNLRRRKRFVVNYSSLSLVRAALPRYSKIRRHLPFALFVAALSCLMLAMARPIAITSVPTSQTTIMLAIDASRSMCSTDILPNRLEAAKAAALTFIENRKANSQIGIVVFAGFAAIIQSPTTDVELLQSAVERISVARRTAIGSGIVKSIDAIAEINMSVAPSDASATDNPAVKPVPKGVYAPAIIVLLTDGVSNVGPLPLDAAQQAADRGIRVYPIGFGTAANSSFSNCGQQFQGGDRFGGGQFFGGGGGGFRRGIDEETLKQVAELTDGIYYSAESAQELGDVFKNLPIELIVQQEVMEISFILAALGAVMVMLSILLAALWHPLS